MHWDPAQLVQIAIGLLVLAATVGARWGRLEAKRPPSIIRVETDPAKAVEDWRARMETLERDVVKLQADVEAATLRRDDLIAENRREHRDFNDRLLAMTHRIDGLRDA